MIIPLTSMQMMTLIKMTGKIIGKCDIIKFRSKARKDHEEFEEEVLSDEYEERKNEGKDQTQK
jgi:hypothetical protein